VGQLLQLERALGLPDRFVVDLADADDWSFIIKAQSLLEAALTQLLAAAVGQPALNDVMSKLNVRGATGKLAFVGALEIAETAHLRFIEKLMVLRNRLVHNVLQVTFDLARYFADGSGRDDGLEQSLFMLPTAPAEIVDSWRKELATRPKPLVWLHVAVVAFELRATTSSRRDTKALIDLRAEVGRRFLDDRSVALNAAVGQGLMNAPSAQTERETSESPAPESNP
jgi:hypothetical protein